MEEALSLSQDFYDKLNRYVKISFTIGVGKSVETLEEAGISAHAAMNSLQSKFFAGSNRVIEGQQPKADPEVKSRINDLLMKLVSALITPVQEIWMKWSANCWCIAITCWCHGKHAAVTSVYGAINRIRQELKDFGIFTEKRPIWMTMNFWRGSHGCSNVRANCQYTSEAIAEIRREATAKMKNKELMQLVQVKS